ncbi:MAG: hypothetical protein AB1490_06205 [Pseudomonadota bacterium]
MKLYTVRKQGGHWMVCADENVVLRFETYDEAIEIARSAAEVLIANRDRQRSVGAAPAVAS